VAELVGAEADRQRHVSTIDEDFVRAREGVDQDARAQAVAIASTTVDMREDEIVRPGFLGRGLVGNEPRARRPRP
jgi:hypothetical protein